MQSSTQAGAVLAGRVAVVTGASSGLGAHLASLLAGQGARVVLAARRLDPLAELCRRIAQRGGQAIAVALDVTDEAATAAAFDAAEQAFGLVDTVIANAGISLAAPAIDLSAADFRQVVDTDLLGVFLTAREAARRMIAAGRNAPHHGSILLMASMIAHKPIATLSAYAAAKAGVVQLGRVLALEWARHGITVNSLCPGYIATEMNAAWFASPAGNRQIDRWPGRRLMSKQDLDGLVSFLASDAARAVTGASFTIDDGQSL